MQVGARTYLLSVVDYPWFSAEDWVAIALSVRQPWVDLILSGRKTIEVRSWSTAHRGPLLVHASRTVEVQECSRFGLAPSELLTGAILGTVELVGCVPFTPETWSSLACSHLNPGDYRPSLIAWMLRDPKRLSAIEYTGRLGLFAVPDHLLAQAGYLTPGCQPISER